MSAARTVFAARRAVAAELRTVAAERRRARPDPPGQGLVLEIGGGQQPHARVDLVVDKYIADDFERPGGQQMAFTKPLVVADGERLPFADGTAAYVIASHVLEHAVDPVVFAAEMSRVGRAGFVQVPSREAELTFGWPFHPWLIEEDQGRLSFTPKNDQRAPCGELLHSMMEQSPTMRLWFAATRRVWHHSVHWVGQLEVHVEGAAMAERTASIDLEQTLDLLTRSTVTGPPEPIRRHLRCPSCGGSLRGWDCVDCSRHYPSASGVPILLAEVAT